jgi:hypothetical protein
MTPLAKIIHLSLHLPVAHRLQAPSSATRRQGASSSCSSDASSLISEISDISSRWFDSRSAMIFKEKEKKPVVRLLVVFQRLEMLKKKLPNGRWALSAAESVDEINDGIHTGTV